LCWWLLLDGRQLLATRNPPDQRLAIDQLNRHSIGELRRRLREGTGCHEDASGGANFVDGPGQLSHAGHAHVINEPVLALHQN
jgi:hypothetical protein